MNRFRRGGPGTNKGITRLEVVTLVLIIGILMGLLLPAINMTRDRSSRRNQCDVRITNLARAAIQHEMAVGEYPGWIQNHGWFTGTRGDLTDPDSDPRDFAFHQKLGGWTVTLLSHLDAQPTYEVWTQDKYPLVRGGDYTESAAPNLPIMQCPSDPMAIGSRGRNSYVSNNGMYHLLLGGAIPSPLASEGSDELTAFGRSMKNANGLFNSKFAGGETPTGDSVRADDLKDGLGTTVLFSESLQAHPWHQVRAQEQASAALLGTAAQPRADEPPRSPDNDVAYPFGEPRFLQGFVWHWEDDDRAVQQATGCPPVDSAHRINGQIELGGKLRDIFQIDLADLSLAEVPHVARPSSAHAGGVYIGFADGASRFVTDSVDYRIYQAMMTPHGAESDVPMSEPVMPGDE